MKKIIFLLCIFQITIPFQYIETERTIWQPWTIEHTQEWEEIEQHDTAPSYFRRNEYFENSNELSLRDTNWLKLCDYINSVFGKKIFFPNLGFAIIRKLDHVLIGTIRMKINNRPGCISFGYALRPEVRNNKFGQEIIKALIILIEELIGSETITLKNETDKTLFMAEWYKEGKKETPHFEHLASFFNPTPCIFHKIIGSVNIVNQASLTVLTRSGMQPFEIECEKYIFAHNNNLFSFDCLLQYPSNPHLTQPKITIFVADILSRDQTRIDNIHNYLKEYFNVPHDWTYAQWTRIEKAIAKPFYQIISSTLFSDDDTTKKLISQIYYPPYCFIN